MNAPLSNSEQLDCVLTDLESLSTRNHFVCEDRWYSCPLSDDGCANDSLPNDECTCGATNHNAAVSDLLEKLRSLL